ncbi:MAG: serpin family protein [Gemmatimonadaceae bacterium]|nr:serpin family protein [Gemmatimonadaceae bacterium]
MIIQHNSRRSGLNATTFAAALTSALLLTACKESGSPTSPRGTDSLAALPRALSAAEQEGVGANNQFALQLLRTSAAGKTDNVLLSPLSVSFALGMTMNGAGGETLEQMQRTLGWGSRTRQDINTAYRDLGTLLPTLDSKVAIHLANGVWLRSGLTPDTSFVRNAREFFRAPVQTVATPQLMFDSVNAWGSRETRGMIPRVMDGAPPPDLVMMLANAVTFSGTWRDEFKVADTRNQPFTLTSGQQVSVPLMTRVGKFRSFDSPELQAAELLYGNGAYGMLLMQPRSGSISTFVSALDSARYATIVQGLREPDSRSPVYLPRFKVSASLELSPALKTMGMTRAFTDAAQFPQLLPGVPTLIRFVKHGVALEVDERGTKAAAVTSVGIGVVSMPPTYRFDRPFVFFIRDRLSGTILFSGVINDPRQ